MKAGFEVFVNEKVPVNDGDLSLGQAVVGLAKMLENTCLIVARPTAKKISYSCSR